MDNNTTEQQNNQSGDQPVFSSTQIVNTKSRTSGSYFTNVQDATLGQKISNWFAKFRRDSEARSEARSAAFKAKLAEKKREADIAAISINIPDNAASISNPAIVKSEAYAEQIAAQAEKKKSSRPALIALIIIVILLIVGIILAIIKPWEPKTTGVVNNPGQTGTNRPVSTTPVADAIDEDKVYKVYDEGGVDALEEYYEKKASEASTEADAAAVMASQFAFKLSVNELDSLPALIEKIDQEKLPNEDRYRYLLLLSTYAMSIGDDEAAKQYHNSAMEVPDVDDLKLGGGA